MLPINKIEHVKRMIDKQAYLFKSSQGKEDKWLFAYLKSQNKTPEQAFEIWKPIFESRHEPDADGLITKIRFSELWADTRRVKLKNKYHTINFTQEEILFLQNMNAKRWQKEAFMLMFAILKARGRKEMKWMPLHDILPLTSLPMRHGHEGYELEQSGTINDVFCVLQERYWDSFQGNYDYALTHVFKEFEDGPAVLSTNYILDVPTWFDDLFGHKICKQCGIKFSVSTKSQTDLCPTCYKNELRRRDRERKRKIPDQ